MRRLFVPYSNVNELRKEPEPLYFIARSDISKEMS